jgi:hypothetical protein
MRRFPSALDSWGTRRAVLAARTIACGKGACARTLAAVDVEWVCQNDKDEDPLGRFTAGRMGRAGIIAREAEKRGCKVDIRRLDREDEISTVDHMGGLVVMGGPWAPIEEDRYPFLRKECELLRAVGMAIHSHYLKTLCRWHRAPCMRIRHSGLGAGPTGFGFILNRIPTPGRRGETIYRGGCSMRQRQRGCRLSKPGPKVVSRFFDLALNNGENAGR